MKKAKLIRRAYTNTITDVKQPVAQSTTEIIENVKTETKEVTTTQNTNNNDFKPNKATILEEKIKQELIRNNTYNVGNVNYKFELLSYGYVTDTIICTEKEKAIRYYFTFEDSYDYAYKFYLNDVLMPNKKIKEVLNITYNMQIDFYRSRSKS